MSESKQLWLVRHGESTAVAARRMAGWADPPLTPRGRSQAATLRPFLNGNSFASVWSSDLERAAATARLAWGPVPDDRRLREINFGDLEGSNFDTVSVARELLAFRDFAAPNGESTSQLRERVQEFIAELDGGRHLLFTHGGVIRVLVQDLGLDRFVEPGTVVALDWHSQQLLFVHELPAMP